METLPLWGLHINVLELTAIRFTVPSFDWVLVGKAVTVMSDNTMVVAYVNRLGAQCPECCAR